MSSYRASGSMKRIHSRDLDVEEQSFSKRQRHSGNSNRSVATFENSQQMSMDGETELDLQLLSSRARTKRSLKSPLYVGSRTTQLRPSSFEFDNRLPSMRRRSRSASRYSSKKRVAVSGSVWDAQHRSVTPRKQHRSAHGRKLQLVSRSKPQSNLSDVTPYSGPGHGQGFRSSVQQFQSTSSPKTHRSGTVFNSIPCPQRQNHPSPVHNRRLDQRAGTGPAPQPEFHVAQWVLSGSPIAKAVTGQDSPAKRSLNRRENYYDLIKEAEYAPRPPNAKPIFRSRQPINTIMRSSGDAIKDEKVMSCRQASTRISDILCRKDGTDLLGDSQRNPINLLSPSVESSPERRVAQSKAVNHSIPRESAQLRNAPNQQIIVPEVVTYQVRKANYDARCEQDKLFLEDPADERRERIEALRQAEKDNAQKPTYRYPSKTVSGGKKALENKQAAEKVEGTEVLGVIEKRTEIGKDEALFLDLERQYEAMERLQRFGDTSQTSDEVKRQAAHAEERKQEQEEMEALQSIRISLAKNIDRAQALNDDKIDHATEDPQEKTLQAAENYLANTREKDECQILDPILIGDDVGDAHSVASDEVSDDMGEASNTISRQPAKNLLKSFLCHEIDCGQSFRLEVSLDRHLAEDHDKFENTIFHLSCGFPGCKRRFARQCSRTVHHNKAGHDPLQPTASASNETQVEALDTSQGSPETLLRQQQGWKSGVVKRATNEVAHTGAKAQKQRHRLVRPEKDLEIIGMRKEMAKFEKTVQNISDKIQKSDKEHKKWMDNVIKLLRKNGGKGLTSRFTSNLEPLFGSGIRTREEAEAESQERMIVAAKKKKQDQRSAKRARDRFTLEMTDLAKSWGQLSVDQIADAVQQKMVDWHCKRKSEDETGVEQPSASKLPFAEGGDPMLGGYLHEHETDTPDETAKKERLYADLKALNDSRRAAAKETKDDRSHGYLGDDSHADTESVVSEEDPDDHPLTIFSAIAQERELEDHGKTGHTQRDDHHLESDEACKLLEPPDNVILNVYTVKRRETLNGKESGAIIMSRFADQDIANEAARNLANEAAKDLLGKYFWGDTRFALSRQEAYTSDGLFFGQVRFDDSGDGEDLHTHRIYIKKDRQFSGDLENGKELEFKVKIPVKTYTLSTVVTTNGNTTQDDLRIFTDLELANQAACDRLLQLVRPVDEDDQEQMTRFEAENAPAIREVTKLLDEQGTCFDTDEIGLELDGEDGDLSIIIKVKELQVEGPLN